MEFFLCVLGVVLVVEGMPWFLSPPKVKAMMREMDRMPEGALRWMGLLLMALGMMVVYFAKNTSI